MASTLKINNLDTASGSTITVASGKTLDASNGFTPPAGHVVQTKFIQQFVNASATTFTVTGAIGGGGLFGGSQGNRTYNQAGSTITITPSSTSSKLVVYATIHFTYFASVATTAHGIMVSLNETANTGGTGATPALESGDFPYYSTHTFNSSGGYWPPQTLTGVFSPNVTSACDLKLRAFGYRESSGTHSVVYRGYNMIVQEIAG